MAFEPRHRARPSLPGFVLMISCRAIVAALVLAASTLGPAAGQTDEPERMKLGEFIPAAPPQPAPELAFTDMAGKLASLDDFKGKFVVLNLWATWCQPCLKEMPSLAAMQAQLGSSLTVLALSEDRGAAVSVRPFLDKHGLDQLKVFLDPNSTASHAFEVRGLPTSLVIGGDGKVLGKVEGAADWNSDQMRAALTKLMAPQTGSGG
jgi:thiol-disulfide isomerase/thioredoxin